MIKLSDYLNYLNNEVIQARKKADEQSIAMAKYYTKHEYLKYFKAPRFSMPSVKLNIPIKINEIDSTTTYNFDRDYDSFVSDVNEKILVANSDKKLNLKPIVKEEFLKNSKVTGVFDVLEGQDYKKVTSLRENMKKVNIDKMSKELSTFAKFTASNDKKNSEAEATELNKIITSSLENRYKPVSSDLRSIFIDPDTSLEADKGKVLLNLEIEMVEEGVMIRNVKDKNGNEIEEIIID